MGATPGWYPDPSGSLRYYDGITWTDSAVAPNVQTAGRFTIHYGFALLAIFSLLGTVLPSGLLFSANVGNTETAGAGTTMAVLWLLWGGMWTLIWGAFAIHHTLKSRH